MVDLIAKQSSDLAHGFIGWKSVPIKVQNTELSCHAIVPNCTMSDHFPDSSLAFSLIGSEISEQASRHVATEEPNKGL